LKRVLLTGANGFVGRSLCAALGQSGYEVRAAVRSAAVAVPGAVRTVCVGDISGQTRWQHALEGVDFVIHAAARAHQVNDSKHNSGLYTSINTEGTACLARAAATAGVQRLVFLSTVKVNGEENDAHAYTATDEPHPQDVYGMSKWLAEQAVNEVCARTKLQAAIVRPPLVYGPGVRANFLRLMRWTDAQRPLPLGSVQNRRSLISIWNLCDLLINVLVNPAAGNRTWMASDADDLSTPELVRRLAAAMRRRTHLLPVPVMLLRGLGWISGRSGEVSRLCGSLAVDVTETRSALGWSPPLSVDEGLARTVAWYLSEAR